MFTLADTLATHETLDFIGLSHLSRSETASGGEKKVYQSSSFCYLPFLSHVTRPLSLYGKSSSVPATSPPDFLSSRYKISFRLR